MRMESRVLEVVIQRFFTAACLALIPGGLAADVVLDGTIGSDISGGPTGPDFVISEDMGKLKGSNLFHSFKEFSLNEHQSATFTGSSFINNVIGRVTGGNVSYIDGLLKSDIAGANLFLLNPDGFVFGPNATLDVQGAFHMSTSQELHFANQEVFSADPAATTILSMASPDKFGFLGESAASIVLDGTVLESKHDVGLHAEDIELNHGARIVTVTEGLEKGGDITLMAQGWVTLSGMDEEGYGAWLRTETYGEGQGGGINIEASRIDLLDGATAITVSREDAQGSAGALSIKARDSLMLSGNNIAGPGIGEDIRLEMNAILGSVGLGGGNAGDVTVRTSVVELRDGAVIASGARGQGATGELNLFASERFIMLGRNRKGSGSALVTGTASANDAGDIFVEAPIIELRDGAAMVAGTWSEGDAGKLTVRAKERLTLSGKSSGIFVDPEDKRGPTGARLHSGTTGKGNGGGIEVDASFISLTDGAGIDSSTRGSGDAGSITITAGELQVTDRSAISSASHYRPSSPEDLIEEATGDEPRFRPDYPPVQSPDNPQTDNGIQDLGNAGSIDITANAIEVTGGSFVSSDAEHAEAGNIDIRTDGLFNLQDSMITTSVYDGGNDGGNININAKLMLISGSQITARAHEGAGGDINIDAGHVLKSPNSVIDASAAGGTDGRLSITAPDTDLTDQLTFADSLLLDAAALLQPYCEVQTGDSPAGGLRVVKHRGLPLSPEDLLLAFDHGEVAAMAAAMADDVDITHELAAAAMPGNMRSAYVSPYQTQVSRDMLDHGDGHVRGKALRALAQHSQARGLYGASLEVLHAALVQADAVGDQRGMAAVLGQAGNAYLALGKAEKAQWLFGKAVERARVVGDEVVLATLFNNLGNLHQVQQRYDDALNAYSSSVDSARQAGEALYQAKALSNGSRAALEAGLSEQALELLVEGRAVAHALVASQAKATVLIHLARSAQRLAEMAPATLRESLAMAYIDLRDAVAISEGLGDQRILSYALGNLGSLYQGRQRLDEALYLTRLARQAAEQASAPESLYRWHWQAGQLLMVKGETEAALQAFRRAVAILEDSRQETLAHYGATLAHFRQAVAPVYLDLVDALLQRAAHLGDEGPGAPLLTEARDTMELLKAAELRDYFRNECATGLEARTTRLEAVASDAAVIYPIVLPGRLELLVNVSSQLHRYTVPVDAATVRQTILDFRTLVQSLGSEEEARAMGRQLYDWLVRPYTRELGDADTLVFVPDGLLRTVPLAALHDGGDYLIRRYRVAVTPGLSLTDPHPLDRQSARFLLAGVSEPVQNFPGLPAVVREIEHVRQLYGGDVLLNQEFTRSQFEQALDTPVSVVHIASHAQFTGDADSSFLLTYDGRLSMGDLDRMLSVTRFHDQPLELLVLSACETAAGDERAALGLAGVGIKAGARSALGSLWEINDEAAAAMIMSFYRSLKNPDVSKAQALQDAQHALLADDRFAHPFYWSPYLLINNWL